MLLHDAGTRSSLVSRINALGPDARGRWGKMSVDQMLWHVNEALETSLAGVPRRARSVPLPRGLLKWIVLNLPWMKGAPTNPAFVATRTHDFAVEHTRCLHLIAVLAGRPLEGTWIDDPTLGRMSGRDVSRLHAKHLDHHLRQFGV